MSLTSLDVNRCRRLLSRRPSGIDPARSHLHRVWRVTPSSFATSVAVKYMTPWISTGMPGQGASGFQVTSLIITLHHVSSYRVLYDLVKWRYMLRVLDLLGE